LEPYRRVFFALGGNNELLAHGDYKTVQSAFDSVEAEVRRIEHKYSRFIKASVVGRINSAAGHAPVTLDEETAALLAYADQCYRESNGLFDITCGVLQRVWDFKAGKVPTQSDLERVLPLVGWQKVHWNASDIFLPVAGMEIDLGGIGKEYAADRAAVMATNTGVFSMLINLGGDIRAAGSKPDGTDWQIGIKHPRAEDKILATLSLSNLGLATSGDYERFFIHQGKRYCHILNPKTGWPVSDLQAVTVIAPLCLVAGTLATASMLLGEDWAANRLKAAQVSAWLVNSGGHVKQIS